MCCKIFISKAKRLHKMKLDTTDREIIRLLTQDGRASYSDISKQVGVSVGTVRNRITAMRESGVLHLNVWLDPYRVGSRFDRVGTGCPASSRTSAEDRWRGRWSAPRSAVSPSRR